MENYFKQLNEINVNDKVRKKLTKEHMISWVGGLGRS